MAAPLAAVPLIAMVPMDLEAKKPGARHCYRQVCVRVRSVKETEKLVGETLTITTSHYGDPRTDRFNTGRYTSNGERFSAGDGSRTASADFPDGTELLLRNPENGRVSHVRVNDFGPFMGSRRLDVTQQVARDLDFFHRGVVDLEVTVLAAPNSDDHVNLYRRNRQTPETGGFLGRYSEVEVAGLAHELIQSSRRKLMARDSAVLAFVSSIVPPRRKPDGRLKPISDPPTGLKLATAADRAPVENQARTSGGSKASPEIPAAPAPVELASIVEPEPLFATPAGIASRRPEVAASAHQPILINATSADLLNARGRPLPSYKNVDVEQFIAARDLEEVPSLAPVKRESTPFQDITTVPRSFERAPEAGRAPSDGERSKTPALAEPGAERLKHNRLAQSLPHAPVAYSSQRQEYGAPSQIQFLALLAAILAATVSIYAFGNIALRSRAGSPAPRRAGFANGHYAAPRLTDRQSPRLRAFLLERLGPAFAPRGSRDMINGAGAAEPRYDDRSLAPNNDRDCLLLAHPPPAGEDQPHVEIEAPPVVEAPRSLPSAAHETVIGEGVTIESDIVSDEAVYIAGEVIGNVSGRRVELAAGAVVTGHIAADHAIIDGRLIGNVDARELSVLPHAELSGNARIEVLSVEPGARVDVAFAFLRPDADTSQPGPARSNKSECQPVN